MYRRKASPQPHDCLSSYALLRPEEGNIVEELRHTHTALVGPVQEHLLRLFDQTHAARQRAQTLRSRSRHLRGRFRQLLEQRRGIREQRQP